MRLLLPIACWLWSVASAFAQPALSPAQALSSIRAGDLHFSPDGSMLAYVVVSYRWDYKPHLRLIDLASGSERELTPATKADRTPQWSPDGSVLGFLSTRDGKPQIYTVPAKGGDAEPLTAHKAAIERFHWSPNGRQIAY